MGPFKISPQADFTSDRRAGQGVIAGSLV